MMTGKEWVEIVSMITGCITAVAAPFVGYVMWTLRQRVDETKNKVEETKGKMDESMQRTQAVEQKIEETKGKVEETKGKMDETIERLNGGVTQLLEETQLRARAEGRAEAKAEAEIAAVELIRVNRIEWEKQTKDKAVADALVLKTAADKARMDEMRQAVAIAEARQAPKAEAPAAPAMVLDAQPQNVELHVSGTMTEVEKDAREKELAKKQEEEKKKE